MGLLITLVPMHLSLAYGNGTPSRLPENEDGKLEAERQKRFHLFAYAGRQNLSDSNQLGEREITEADRNLEIRK